MLDAYLWSARETAQVYATDMLLATEHAQIDDNGDGRGTELQSQFLSEELGGRRISDRKLPVVTSGDGIVARQILLRHPPSPPPPEADPK